MDDLDTKDIYLKKGDEIIGLHSVGYAGPYEYTLVDLDGTETQKTSDFMAIETWGNIYDENYNILGRGSFRVHQMIEDEAADFEAEGWIRFERVRDET